MPTIDHSLFAIAYKLALDCRAQKITERQAIGVLVSQHDMKQRSADAYVSAVRHMLTGDAYRQTINQSAVRYFLSAIDRDLGLDAARAALRSLDHHITYYESVQSARMIALRRISIEVAASIEARSLNEFERLVEHAIRLPEAERRRLLPPEGHKPREYMTSVRVFDRSQYVVAEVLARAKGKCQSCDSVAPFLRKSNGQPYLEVHHRMTLAQGGPDTVDNAIALCPNCHRRSHYG